MEFRDTFSGHVEKMSRNPVHICGRISRNPDTTFKVSGYWETGQDGPVATYPPRPHVWVHCGTALPAGWTTLYCAQHGGALCPRCGGPLLPGRGYRCATCSPGQDTRS
jgi:hypothetical protein